ncbi:EGF-containing fibulin-like extracellular matrix protein 1, partial [Elysia marginata]
MESNKNGSRFSVIRRHPNDYSLKIRDSVYTDSGLYRCMIVCPRPMRYDGCPGYTEKKTHLELTEIDECETEAHNCSRPASRCVNMPGTFRCDCNDGYRKKDFNCEDIDECRDPSRCAPNDTYKCVNKNGSYDCVCRPEENPDPDC